MRGPLAAASILLLCAPLAQACSSAGPPSQDFGWLGIDGPDGVVAYVQGGWKRFNVTDGSVAPTHSRYEEPTRVGPPDAGAAAPDGTLRLEPRYDLAGNTGYGNTCWDK